MYEQVNTHQQAARMSDEQLINYGRLLRFIGATEILRYLTPREQKILEMRFGLLGGETKTLEETGKEFGVTRERIRQMEAKAVEKIRVAIRKGFDPEIDRTVYR